MPSDIARVRPSSRSRYAAACPAEPYRGADAIALDCPSVAGGARALAGGRAAGGRARTAGGLAVPLASLPGRLRGTGSGLAQDWLRSAGRRGRARSGLSGSSIVTVRPPPGVSERDTVPPLAVT